MGHHHVVELYPAGRAMPQGTVRQVEALFEEYYHHYHYLSKLADICRIRILALNEAGHLMGFASLQQKGTFALLSNLLVTSRAQGKGYGSTLEEVRIKLSRDLQLVPYSSCVTVGMQSQKLKLKYGLTAINYRLGYRTNVFTPDDVSSAVTFVGDWQFGPSISRNLKQHDEQNNRARLICATQDFFDHEAEAILPTSNGYVDALVHPDVVPPQCFTFQGLDIDLDTACWGHLWQLNNSARQRGMRGSLDLAVSFETVLANARHMSCNDARHAA